MDFKSNLIYPEIKITKKNIVQAKKILNIYSGRNSIINNILTYLYQSSFLEEKEANYLKKIIDVEILHAKIISKLISELGFYPRYIYENFENYKYFNTSYINYDINKENIMTYNLMKKEELINEINKIIENTDNKNIKEILERIIIDEKIHVKIFKEILTY